MMVFQNEVMAGKAVDGFGQDKGLPRSSVNRSCARRVLVMPSLNGFLRRSSVILVLGGGQGFPCRLFYY